ncbi:hypothetical protein F511_20046 [Dorcoceras hygrometricum]|uniref:Uncharacterized protein n=1 Tax=Dorcoceras hygrometricum TaxID=472368 RepID=A0A2Z7C9I7_9LAMI|nr:hypothetical protein F511_20046 [Dorcoceras hygrometricum]
MRMEFSESMVPAHNSCMKKSMKVEFCLLHDIIAKALTSKARSVDDATQRRFDLMMSIMGGIKINWCKILFRILKAMVVPSTKQAQGFDVLLSLLLEGVPRLKLGESKALPSLKILSAKSVGTYVANNKSTMEELVEKNKSTGETVISNQSQKAGGFPIQMTRPPKRKLILLEDSDSEDPKSLLKEIKLSEPMVQTTMSWMKSHILEVPDAESLSLDALYRYLWAKHYPPSAMTRKPITEIQWSQGIHIREVNWYTRSLSKMAPADKGNKILFETPKGNPVKETSNLIFADLEFFVKIRDYVFVRVCDYLHISGFDQPKCCSTQRSGVQNQFGAVTLSRAHDILKTDFNERMKSLELSVEDLHTPHVALVNKEWRQHSDFLRRGDKLKADLSSEITSARFMLHEEAQKQSADINSSIAYLSSQLAKVVAHLKRAGDVKKGEGDSSSSSRKGESSSGDRCRDSVGKRIWF